MKLPFTSRHLLIGLFATVFIAAFIAVIIALVQLRSSLMLQSSQELKRSDYDVLCREDTDCVTIFVGSPCDPCSCHNDGISKSSRADYDQDLSKAVCPPRADVDCSCAYRVARCVGGVCSAEIE